MGLILPYKLPDDLPSRVARRRPDCKLLSTLIENVRVNLCGFRRLRAQAISGWSYVKVGFTLFRPLSSPSAFNLAVSNVITLYFSRP